MEFRKTTQEDLEYVSNHSVSRGIFSKQPECIDYCYTLEHEGRVLGVGGFRLINPTTAWCWVDLTHHAGKCTIICYRTIKEWMLEFVKAHEIKRLQAYIEPDFPEAVRIAQHLGFEKESIMENFLPNGNAFLYRRLF